MRTFDETLRETSAGCLLLVVGFIFFAIFIASTVFLDSTAYSATGFILIFAYALLLLWVANYSTWNEKPDASHQEPNANSENSQSGADRQTDEAALRARVGMPAYLVKEMQRIARRAKARRSKDKTKPQDRAPASGSERKIMRAFDDFVIESSAGFLRFIIALALIAIFFATGASSTLLAVFIMVYLLYCYIAIL